MARQEFTDAIALLKADHREVEELFSQFENARGQERKQDAGAQEAGLAGFSRGEGKAAGAHLAITFQVIEMRRAPA